MTDPILSTVAPVVQLDSVTKRAWRFFARRCQESGQVTSPAELEAESARIYSEFKQELFGLLLSGQDEISVKSEACDESSFDDLRDLVAAVYVATVDLGFGIFPPKCLRGSTTQVMTIKFYDQKTPPRDTGARIIDLSPRSGEIVKTT